MASGGVMTVGWQTDADAKNSNIGYCLLKSVIGYAIGDQTTDH